MVFSIKFARSNERCIANKSNFDIDDSIPHCDAIK